MPECPECGDEYEVDDGCEPDMCHPCAHSIAEGQINKLVSTRDLTIRDLRADVVRLRAVIEQADKMVRAHTMPYGWPEFIEQALT
jgi:hypothetical protein